MRLTSKEINQQIILSDQALKDKEYNQAAGILNTLIKTNPDYAPAYRKIGSILMQTQTPQNALGYLNRAIELAPDDAENWNALGRHHKHFKSWEEALNAFQKSLQLTGDSAQVYYEAMEIHRILNNHNHALNIIQKILKMEPNDTYYRWEYAKLLVATENKKEALEQYKILINTQDRSIPVGSIFEWYELMVYFQLEQEAQDKLRILSENNNKNATLRALYARSCEDMMDTEKALQLCLEAHKIEPQDRDINNFIAGLYNQLGNKERSIYHYKLVIENNPLYITSLRALGLTERYTLDSDNFRYLNIALAHLAELSIEDRSELHYTAGKAYDDLDMLDIAYEHYKLAGKLHANGKEEQEYTELLHNKKAIQKAFTKTFFEHNKSKGHKSNKPIFILGMPRSGTTLIEQVLSGIDGVYGAGELSYSIDALDQLDTNGFQIKSDNSSQKQNLSYTDRGEHYLNLIERLAPEGTKHIIDKMPDNFKTLGQLKLILPNASIIHSRRHPVEICLSAYRLHFRSGHYWSDDLQAMGRYYRLYHELMQYWKSVLPEGAILDVRYEDMVDDLERESRRLADYIGVEWDEKCLAFHKNERAVRTASLSQVRQPIYKTSINRWRRYEPYLQPLLDEIGDLVEEYESEATPRR
ncbi:MAG: sulfotransferase [Campylobacterota bacterium]|nr:sulfotransferase [Campylobacterota bacterium]